MVGMFLIGVAVGYALGFLTLALLTLQGRMK